MLKWDARGNHSHQTNCEFCIYLHSFSSALNTGACCASVSGNVFFHIFIFKNMSYVHFLTTLIFSHLRFFFSSFSALIVFCLLPLILRRFTCGRRESGQRGGGRGAPERNGDRTGIYAAAAAAAAFAVGSRKEFQMIEPLTSNRKNHSIQSFRFHSQKFRNIRIEHLFLHRESVFDCFSRTKRCSVKNIFLNSISLFPSLS